MKRVLLAIILPLAGVTAIFAAHQDPAVFRSATNLVVLHVNVFDRHFNPVPAPTRDNFLVVEDNQVQPIAFFSAEDVPVTAGLVIDNSSSMIPHRRMVVTGGMAFANSSHADDQLFTVSFTERVRLGLPAALPFTPSRPMLQATLNAMTPGGRTALYDAVIRALDHIQGASHQKRVLIVLSDGDDTASGHTRKQMLDRARHSDVIIYTIGLDSRSGESDPGTMKDLAQIGGAVAYFPRSEDEVIRAFETIARNIRQGYSLGYVPSNTTRDGGARRITIMLRGAGRHLEAKYRHTYTAPTDANIEP